MTPDAQLVVDASVAVKWYVPEVGSDVASALLDGAALLLAPDILVAEFGNTVWKKVRKGELKHGEAKHIINTFISACPVALRPSIVLLRGAFDVALRLQRPIYDALYLALAVVEGCSCVTADDALVRAVYETTLQKFVRSLTDN